MDIVSGTVVERYAIEGLLGQGGMAAVYRARHTQLGSEHAIKVLLLPADAIRSRLLQEGRVQARLRHPNIVSVTDVIDISGAPGLVMELVDGPSLDAFLADGPPPLELADELARGILAGVAEAHRVGVIHRDLKPSNVLLQRTGQGYRPKVADFGLVKVLSADDGAPLARTRTGVTMGTPCYMAPEQIRNAKAVDARADVFACGAILYELVTGRRSFDQEDMLELFNAITAGRYTPATARVPALPARMVRAIEGALVADPARRIQSAEELLAAWCGETVPVRSARPSAPTMDPLAVSQPSLMPPRPRRALAPWVLGVSAAVAAGGVALAATGGVVWWLVQAPPVETPAPPPIEPPVVDPPVVDPPVVDPPVIEVAPPKAPVVEAPPPIPAPVVTADARPEEPAAPAEPPPEVAPTRTRDTTTARYDTDGEAVAVTLIGANGRNYDLGPEPIDVEPGSYAIMARFPGNSQVAMAGGVVVSKGRALVIRCGKGIPRCHP